MIDMKNVIFILFTLFLGACGTTNDADPLNKLIQSETELLDIAQNPAHKVQIIYTQIDRDAQNRPSFTNYTYGLDTTHYFYPASTVKFPTALLALERLNELDVDGLDKHSTFQTGAATPPQTAVLTDSSKADLLPTVAHYIKKILLVSDNDAYNRLYEFLGQAYINERLRAKGFTRTRIIHRLSVSGYDSLANRRTNPVVFLNGDSILYRQNEVYSNGYPDWTLEDQIQGKAFMNGDGEIIDTPFDFTYKNYMSLLDLHDILQASLFPDAVPVNQTFNLTREDYDLIYEYMSKLPRESEEPAYPDLADWDDYVKFLLYGSSKQDIPEHIRIFNKVGDAYGYLTDAAYIIDTKNGVEFMLAAAIHVNENQTFNDGVYEYDEIGFPFLKKLGETIYAYELQRDRAHQPDFSRFSFEH
jgi:beta-lactamase class A